MKKLLILLFIIPTITYAQPATVTPADATLRAVNIITQLGQLAQSQENQIKELTNQVEILKKQLEEAKKDKKND